jgi:hypothetical protein
VCFSLEADLAVGVALVPVGILALREVRRARELPFAALPMLFAVHQLIEAVVWAGVEGGVTAAAQHAAAVAYLIIALPLLPVLVPFAVILLEPNGARLRVVPFLALGGIVASYFGASLASAPVGVVVHAHALVYETGIRHGALWSVPYVIAVIGASVCSGYRSIVAFGWVNLVGLSVVGVAYQDAFASLWCLYAAAASVLVLVHMVRRRRLPDLDRVHGIRHAPPRPLGRDLPAWRRP